MEKYIMNGEWLAIKPEPPRTMNPITGIHIPETVQRLDDFHRGLVLGVGEGFDGSPITNVKPGDGVLFQSQLGYWVNRGAPNEYMLVRHCAVVRFFRDEEA